MKIRHLIFTFLVLGINLFSNAQTTWAPVGAIWHYEYHGGWGEYISYITLEATKDTVILGKDCRKLEQRGPGSNPDQWTSDNYFTYESNDTAWMFDGTEFRMLFDFGANEGESWEAYGPSFGGICIDSLTTVNIDSIGNETINGVELKYLKASTPEPGWGFNNCSDWEENHKIIQKIGPMEFLFPQETCGADMPTVCFLRCYEDDEIGFYTTGIADSCTYEHGVGIEEIEVDNRIQLYPNPVTDDLVIELKDIDSKVSTCNVQIKDTFGNTIKVLELTQKVNTIPISGLNAGVYLFTFVYDNFRSTRKVIKL